MKSLSVASFNTHNSSSAWPPPPVLNMAGLPSLMQRHSLAVSNIIDYAARWHPEQTVVCKTPEGLTSISTYADMRKRAQLCALAVSALGVG